MVTAPKNLVTDNGCTHIWSSTLPSCATFALLKTVDDNKNDYPENVMSTNRQNVYVDDC